MTKINYLEYRVVMKIIGIKYTIPASMKIYILSFFPSTVQKFEPARNLLHPNNGGELIMAPNSHTHMIITTVRFFV